MTEDIRQLFAEVEEARKTLKAAEQAYVVALSNYESAFEMMHETQADLQYVQNELLIAESELKEALK